MSTSILPSKMSRADFVARYGGVFEHSAWVAEGAFDRGLSAAADTASGLHAAMCAVLDGASPDQKLVLIRAHPDLAGKLARAGGMTADSVSEQADAGLDRLSASELARFTHLNDSYMAKFGFPFVMAVKGSTKDDILAAFETRVANSPAQEEVTVLAEIKKIASFRLQALLP